MTADPARATVIDGKAFAAGLVDRVAAAAARLETSHGVKPGLAVVIVGEDPASQVYVRNKGETTQRAGMRSDTHRLADTTTQADLLALIATLNADPGIHGILVQLPLPAHIDSSAVLDAIDPDKDVDGFHVVNAGRLAVGLPGLVPCTPLGCLMLLKAELGELSGLNAVIVGRSNIVGKPMAQLLLGESCTVTVAHSRTRDLPALCRTADILVAAVGRPGMVRGDWVKPGAAASSKATSPTSRVLPSAALTGSREGTRLMPTSITAATAGRITPVPGGVGPMTIACLLANTYTAACRSIGVEPETLDA